MAEHIRIIKHTELHPEIASVVKEIRKTRRVRVLPTALFPVSAALYRAALNAPREQGYNVMFEAYALIAGAAPLILYKKGSTAVRETHDHLYKAIDRAKTLDAEGKIKPEDVRKTHPFAFVNRKGDLVLVPKTRFQDALFKAQQTFLKHVVPGRYRVKL